MVLFADTFMRFYHPEVGQAAVAVLEGLGYRVDVPELGCCGRPMISKGLLDLARACARQTLARLAAAAPEGVPVVGCEPSCLLTFRDEIPDLVPGEQARRVARQAVLIDEFLHRHIRQHGWPVPPGTASGSGPAAGRRVLLHGHCHQKALVGMRPAREVLQAAGCVVEEVDAGCCGMAGSFGFEREHYDLSLAIGERRLLPAVRSQPPDVEVAATGTSCRQQIAHGTGRPARHLVEVLARALDPPRRPV